MNLTPPISIRLGSLLYTRLKRLGKKKDMPVCVLIRVLLQKALDDMEAVL